MNNLFVHAELPASLSRKSKDVYDANIINYNLREILTVAI